MNKNNLKNDYTLRISVTPVCNLNCEYCNPKRTINYKDILSDKDLLEIIESGVSAGIRKVSWTGGEPTMRNNFTNLVKQTKSLGIRKQYLTTNGILFFKTADELKNNGITRVNFSLDTLNSKQYKKICRFDGLRYVIRSIKKSVEIYNNTKINCVITNDNFSVIDDFIKFSENFGEKLKVRFLEIVPCGQIYEEDKTIFKKKFVPVNKILNRLKTYGRLISVKNMGEVPKSSYFKISGLKSIYGINPNHSVNYRCDKLLCKKIRVNPQGFVSNCTINLEFVRDFRNKTLKERKRMMKELVLEKMNRDYTGFRHQQKYYDFWRFRIMPNYIKRKFQLNKLQ